MQQAILITAYKNAEQLLEIINYFPSSFNFYIHVDKKSDIEPAEIAHGKAHVKVYKKYSVNWGSYNHLKAIAFLSREALKNESNGFFHLISGQDFPIKSVHFFKNKLNLSKDYLDYFPMPAERWTDDGGMDRLRYYNLYDTINAKKNKPLIDKIVSWQKRLRLRRTMPSYFPQLYGGSTWWSLTRNTLQFALGGNAENARFFRRMRFTYCSEEIFFHTVILNSPVHAANVVNDGLRYIDWHSGRGGYPAVLDESDFPVMTFMSKLFARKLELPMLPRLKTYMVDNLAIADKTEHHDS